MSSPSSKHMPDLHFNSQSSNSDLRLNGLVVDIEMQERGTKETNPRGSHDQSEASSIKQTPSNTSMLVNKTNTGGSQATDEASSIKETPSKTAMLVNFLPTGTVMIFNTLIGPITETGKCDTVNFIMMIILLALCVTSCFVFQLVDSYKDGRRVCYGIVTRKGLLVFTSDLEKKYKKGEKYTLQDTDIIHAIMSVLVFVVFALSDKRVTGCLLPEHEVVIMAEVMKTLPIIFSIICSGLVLIFPNTRFGVGMRG
ncbi:protein DMP9-like [Macadamia integrifolia]|uniref:protein DMP9-like n=1 Tax=Macadamia integrifolia TaxID=60698 RepID=UPI001C4E78C7|nr:protein DMP9-like [Macadamia integrifolia]